LSGRDIIGYNFLSISKEGFVLMSVKPAFKAWLSNVVSNEYAKDVEWLQHHTEQYRSTKNNMCKAIEDFDEVEKLGQGFSSVNPLEEIDIGDGITPRPTFVNKNMFLENKDSIIKMLRDYVDCFAWNYHEMAGLSRELVEHRLPIKFDFRPYKQPAQRFNPIIHDWVKEEVERLLNIRFIRP
jgi:hypothetical protein